MEVWQARYFLAVADELSFRGAAARLNVSQPPISRAIAKLEEELGVLLFDRSERRIKMTAAGDAFRSEAAALVEQASRAVDAARGAAPRRERITVGFEGSSVYGIVPRAIGHLRASRPELDIDLAEMTTLEQVSALKSGALDAGFLVPPLRDAALSVAEVWRDELVCVMARAHPMAGRGAIPLAALGDEPFVTGSRRNRCGLHLHVLALCRSAGFEPTVALDVNELQMALGFIAAGVGIGLLPASAARRSPEGIVAVPLRSPAKVGLAVAARHGETSPACRELLEIAAGPRPRDVEAPSAA